MNRIKQMWDDLSKRTRLLIGAVLITIALFWALGPSESPYESPTAAMPAPSTTSGERKTPEFTAPASKATRADKLILSKKNTITLRGAVTEESMAKLEKKLIDLSESLSASDPIYLALYTPGGSIDAGLGFITLAKGLPQKIHTITIFSASMGFHIVQSLGDRMILPSGILMSHRARGGVSGEIPGSASVRMAFFLRMLEQMDRAVAERVGISLKSYQELIRDEYWTFGSDAVAEKMADKTVYPKCASDLSGIETLEIATLFGKVRVKFSECPLITGPLGIDFSDTIFNDDSERRELMKFIREMVEAPEDFVTDYVITQKYKDFLN